MSDCIFCKIARGEIESEIVYSDDKVCAFKDVNPRAPVHILIIPKRHVAGIESVNSDEQKLLGHMILAARDIARKNSIDSSGYRILTNSGKDAGQVVQHLHFHLLGGEALKPI